MSKIITLFLTKSEVENVQRALQSITIATSKFFLTEDQENQLSQLKQVTRHLQIERNRK